MPFSHVTRPDIEAMEGLVRPHVRTTPTIRLNAAELGAPPCELCLKLELMQHAGSFKTRGAFANLLTRDVPSAGVVAASGGNHGAAVAYAARELGITATIFVPEISSPAKMERIRSYGANLHVTGRVYAEALEASEAWQAESGAMPVHAFDQVETLLGQGTLGCELEAQADSVDTVLVAVGGGGLIGGIAAWYENRVKVVGVEPEASPTLHRALQAGKPVDAPAGGLAADSLAPRQVGQLVYPIARDYVGDVVLVGDDDIRAAQRTVWDRLRVVAEPGGSAAIAALLSGRYTPQPDERVAIVMSGGNTTAVNFDR